MNNPSCGKMVSESYEEVTGDKEAFYKICKQLPIIIDEIISENDEFVVENDTVISELSLTNPDILKSLYMLAFSTYEGFKNECK